MDVAATNENRDDVAALYLGSVRHVVRPVLSVLDISAIRYAVGSLDDSDDRITAYHTRIALMILDVYCKISEVVAKCPLNAVTDSGGRWSETGTRDESQRADGLQQSSFGWVELDDVVFLWLEAAADLAQLLKFDHGFVLGVQNLNVGTRFECRFEQFSC